MAIAREVCQWVPEGFALRVQEALDPVRAPKLVGCRLEREESVRFEAAKEKLFHKVRKLLDSKCDPNTVDSVHTHLSFVRVR